MVLTAAVWDLRVFTAYRTDVAREIYVVAELIANGASWSSRQSVEHVIGEAVARLGQASAGVLHVAVVGRATTRHDTTPCTVDDEWCAPRVVSAMYDNVFPSGSGDCASFPQTLPDEGDLFAADAVVLPFENADPDGSGPETAPTVDAWVSRSIRPDEWWVIVESCSHFGQGPRSRLIGRRVINLGLAWLEVTPVMHRRAAWGSVDDLGDCVWCE